MLNFTKYKQLLKNYSNQELQEQLEILTKLSEDSWDNFQDTCDTGYLDVMGEADKQIEYIKKEQQIRHIS